MKQKGTTQRFCRNCATVLTDTDITCPQCGFSVGTGMRYCPYCGDPIAIGAAACTTCGQSLDIGDVQPIGMTAQSIAAPTREMQDANAPYIPPQAPQIVQPNGQQPVNYVPHSQQGGYVYPNGTVPQNGVVYTAAQQKSKITAGILGIMVGAFGVHNFYLGYVGKGVAQLLLTLLSCGAFTPITTIWALIEGIMILVGSISTDGKGIPLKD